MVRRIMVGLALLALVGAAACNKTTNTPSGGATTPPSTETPTESPSETPSPSPSVEPITVKGTKDIMSGATFTLMADNDGTTAYYFNPTYLKARPGEKITVVLKNVGHVPHNFSITALNINDDLAVGKSMTIKFTLPGTGDVKFFCEYHHSLGMRGAFFFGSAPQASGASAGSSGSGY